MGIKIKRALRYFRNNPTIVFFYIFLGCFILFLGTFAFNKAKIYFIQTSITSASYDLQARQSEYDSMASSENFKRYQLADYILKTQKGISWKSTIESLVFMYDKIKSLNGAEQGIAFDNFKIDMDKVKISVTSPDIQKVYTSGGLIDRFVELDFIKNINIPSYTKEGNSFKFNLDAKIKINDSNSAKQ